MNSIFLLLAVLLPLGSGALLFGAKNWNWRKMQIYNEAVVLLTSLLVLCILLFRPTEEFLCFNLTGNLRIILKLDGLGSVFAGLVAFLWPFAMLYSFAYLAGEKPRRHTFFGFYTMTYGVTLGVAFAGNILTLYCFYELLTLVTVYLVMHSMTKKAIRASRMYLYFSLGGAAFAFLSIICLIFFGDTGSFLLGGALDASRIAGSTVQILVMFTLAFCGFGVKAALFPFHAWLPKASVAPTPVTALLHAVAVVKSGAFAIIRLIYYSYGADYLRGTWAQYAVMLLAMITILYGSTMAVKEIHIKRKLAYSTVSNLSYVLLGATIMTASGMAAAMCHLVVHAFMKICGFLCIGAVMHQTGRSYLDEIHGLGRRMPITFGCLTVAGISLAGIPPFGGFISKWKLALAALEWGNPMGIAAVGVLLYSALLTAVYMGQILFRAWFPAKDCVLTFTEKDRDPDWRMKLSLITFACIILFLGLFSGPLLNFFTKVAQGIF